MTKPDIKILSIDGGGIRGVIPCRILAFIESQIGMPLSDVFDLIAGTSTGGIISLGLASENPATQAPFSAEEMLELYKENGDTIFGTRKSNFWTRLASVTPLKDLVQYTLESKGIESVLLKYFGERRLKNSLTDVFITSHDLESNRPFYFSSRIAKQKTEENYLVREAARATSAAPTYFEPVLVDYKKDNDLALIDGGVLANNPAVLAYSEAKEIFKQKNKNKKVFDPEVAPDDSDLPFYMLSLGTGHVRRSISGEKAKEWGTLNWIKPLVSDIFMQSVAASTHYTIQHLLPPYTDGTKRYDRIAFEIPENLSDMDEPKNIVALIAIADEYIKQNKKELLTICDILTN
ncbi:MAG: patatin [Cytophagales bacterium]|nr:MAG: patatin [Cytophagales bacterium]